MFYTFYRVIRLLPYTRKEAKNFVFTFFSREFYFHFYFTPGSSCGNNNALKVSLQSDSCSARNYLMIMNE